MNMGYCSICLENFRTTEMAVLRNCGHSFHQKCISQAIQIKKECPLCRAHNNSEDVISPRFDNPTLNLLTENIKNEALNIALGYYDRIYKQNNCCGSSPSSVVILSPDEQREQLHACLLNLITTIDDQSEDDDKHWEELKKFVKIAGIAAICAIFAFLCYLYWPLIAPIAGRIASFVWDFIKGLRDFIRAHQPEILAGIVGLMEFGIAWKASGIFEEDE
uniref:RING-type domain-containing protein n=1 Tax=Meloidogyne incognita TaxID=6306 RepID=A0A914L6Z3_MELIC